MTVYWIKTVTKICSLQHGYLSNLNVIRNGFHACATIYYPPVGLHFPFCLNFISFITIRHLMHKLTSDRVSPTISSDLFLLRSFGAFVFSSEYLHQLFAHVVWLLGGTIVTFKILHCIENRNGKFLF